MKTMNKIILSSLSLMIAGTLYAQGPQGGPPPEALDACAGKAASAQCTMMTPGGQLSGQCIQTPHGLLACMPEGHRRGQRPQGPDAQNQPPGRSHTALQGKPFNLIPATVNPIAQSRVSIDQQGGFRVIR